MNEVIATNNVDIEEQEVQKVFLCIYCAHYSPVVKLENAVCSHPNFKSLVDGKSRTTCESLRTDSSKCGEQARYFEPIK
jgi:hypothetical protein